MVASAMLQTLKITAGRLDRRPPFCQADQAAARRNAAVLSQQAVRSEVEEHLTHLTPFRCLVGFSLFLSLSISEALSPPPVL
ncbi:hypothetical protein NEUTE2DRAFT_55428 [Neurospora tetrasperma FGSC 2509]|nr:hypothetical protein NEUTE2DRAFT_55428 [Neurospora tetrasperma FGSC 2509]